MEIGSKSSVPSATAHVKVLDVDGRVILKDLACIQERFQWTRLDALRLLSHRSESYSWDLRPSEPCFQAKTVIYFANLQHLVPHSINVEAPLVVINFSWVADLNKLAMASMTRKFRIGSPWRLVLIIGTDEHPLDFLPPFRRSIRYLFEHITSPTRRLPQLTVVGLEKLNRGTVQSDFRRQALLYFDCIGCPFGLKCPGYTQATSEMRDAHVVDFISRDEYLVQLSPREQRLHTVDYPSAIAPIRPIVDPGEADLIRFEEVYGFTNSSGSDSPSSGSGTERT
jgi:hypothetical protein